MAAEVWRITVWRWHSYNSIWIGFPLSNVSPRTWLLSAADPSQPKKAAQQLHAFMYFLLNVTCNHLEAIASECGKFTVIALLY